MLVYGQPGIGKTRFAGTSPKALILECGTGETDTNAAAGQSADVMPIESRDQLTEAYEWLRQEGHKEYEWVWLDSLGGLEGRLMREQLALVKAKSPHRSEYVPDKAEYQMVQSIMDRYINYFVDLPMNFGCTAHVMFESETRYDEDGDEQEVLRMMPAIQGGRGKLSQKVCGYMNIVGYMERISTDSTENVRAMLVVGDGHRTAKDRFAVLGNKNGWMLNPTVPKIEAAVKEKLSAKSRPAAAKKATKSVAKKATPTKAVAKKAAGLRTK